MPVTSTPSAVLTPSATDRRYTDVWISSATVVHRNFSLSFRNYIMNTSSTVSIVGRGGSDVFTVLPNEDSLLLISNLNVSSDVIDLQAFITIRSASDQNWTFTHSTRRHLRQVSDSSAADDDTLLAASNGNATAIVNIVGGVIGESISSSVSSSDDGSSQTSSDGE
eukprot:gene42921-53252_t